MKKFLLTFLLFFTGLAYTALAFSVPTKPTTYINDYASVLSQEEIQKLEEKVQSFERETTNEIIVVIISSLDGDVIENVANEIYNSWGIGKKDKNNGALFIASIEDRKMRIEVGYGLEGVLTDVGTAYIQDNIVRPTFQTSDYYDGINGAIDAMIGLSKNEYSIPESSNTKNKISSIFNNLGFVFFIIAFLFQFLASLFARSKSWWAGGIVGGGFGVFNLIVNFFALTFITNLVIAGVLAGLGLLFDYFVSKNYKKWKDGGGAGSPPWFIGGGSGGRGGGSFGGGGFGGGSSGGGGSSSSW